jgi:hypothetical protein
MPWHKQLIFYGDAESPLLAPRGVCLHGNLLVVSDTGQNRVFVKHDSSRCMEPPGADMA